MSTITSPDHLLDLPDYREQLPQVAERFARIRERPVILTVRDLSKQFRTETGPRYALKGIDLTVHRREFVTVIGPSGCGKSTLIRLVAGLDEPTSGEMLVDDKPVHGPGADRGMVFQGYTLFPWRTVKQNVMFGLEIKKGGNIESEARTWLRVVGLEQFADYYPHELSGGMKQRVAIARALATNPRILIMDEPFGALDAQTRCQMQAYLQQIWRMVDVTILFITHDLDEAIYLSDRIIVLGANPGRIVEVIENPVPRPRSVDQFITPAFLSVKRRLEELIHPRDSMVHELPIVRMTEQGDDVE